MKIGDEVYVHGFIDEIRNDVIIIRNDGGYFGTVPSEVADQEPKRGKWIDKGNFYVCSECGERMTYAVLGSEFSRAYAFMSDYCPHCGSAMEVESDEE